MIDNITGERKYVKKPLSDLPRGKVVLSEAFVLITTFKHTVLNHTVVAILLPYLG